MWRHQIRCSDSKFPGHRSDQSSPPPSPVARLAFLRRAPRLRDRAWRSVACYRSGTVAGSHGIPSILRRKAKAFGAGARIQRTSRHPNEPSNSVNRSSVLRRSPPSSTVVVVRQNVRRFDDVSSVPALPLQKQKPIGWDRLPPKFPPATTAMSATTV